ncbi:FAD-dependent oxidoreductase [Acaryochloris sp. IP29b_bin.148]|uniref:FAD-dependent oxidoreductase n=1 Tax=Acaryochloris sp. IP29b_bin.148 TaxID=2969218 RepID=UPI002608A630|nr:FAD-dependent oxidoreductase [Acaryochloris sp. IP29b_bin.148]
MMGNGILEAHFFLRPTADQELTTPILVVGGSTAAYAATLGALQAGGQVCLVQPQVVLGGQFTAQGLPASDDGKLLTPYELIPPDQRDPNQLRDSECFALSRSQRQFRQCQRQHQPVASQMIQNPGGSWVSHLSVTPTVASDCLNAGIQPYLEQGVLTLIPGSIPTEVLMTDAPRRIIGVRFVDQHTHHRFTVKAQITLEATDLGDLLELGEIPSRVGQESRAQTQEAALPEDPRPECQQAITFCAVVERSDQNPSPVPSPSGYDQKPWLQSSDFTDEFWIRQQDQWQKHEFYDPDGMFRYRRLYRGQEGDAVQPGDITVLNWATSPLGVDGGPPDPSVPLGCGNDYPWGCLLGVSVEKRQEEVKRARDRTQAYLHYLQTHGHPELKPRADLAWTDDGIALEPYIREARRGIALTTIRHEDVAAKFFPHQVRARTFTDSVGIGQYHYLDVHPNHAKGHVELGDGHNALPFTLPLSALIPIDTDGFILSAKSIGTTHITNAAYRMHPMEWAIGEAGGHLAAFALQQSVTVQQVAQQPPLREQFQSHLAQQGIPLVWFNDVGHDDPDFVAIQVLTVIGILPIENGQTLNFLPEVPIGRGRFYLSLVKTLGWHLASPDYGSLSFEIAIRILRERGAGMDPKRASAETTLTVSEVMQLVEQLSLSQLWAEFDQTLAATEWMTYRHTARFLWRLRRSTPPTDP